MQVTAVVARVLVRYNQPMQTVLTILITLFAFWFVTAVAVGYYMVCGLREYRRIRLVNLASSTEKFSAAVQRHLRN